ncbi:hypothetical protein LTR50_001238 [Elasticomyces elasticus]|nr:hypothetical protein LTR50_001238 [Elasticomyces elasticus]
MPPKSARYITPSLLRLLSTTDSYISHLTRCLSTASGIDTTLLTISYTLTLLSSQLTRALRAQYELLALSLVSKASDVLLPGETIFAEFEPPQTKLALVTAGTKALADLISDFRIFLRLWGLLGIYAWARATYFEPPKDAVVKVLVWAQVAVNTAYQILENGAYLAQHGVLRGERWSAKSQARLWAWSSRFWMGHVALEFLRLGRTWQTRDRAGEGLGIGVGQVAAEGVAEDDEKAVKVSRKEDMEAWWRTMRVNLAYAPMTLHWSMEDGCLNDTQVGALGMVAGFIGFGQLWASTA